MSTGTSTQAALTQGRQSTKEPDASQHSALFYLFQEVSKLTSPIHSTFVDTDSPCPWQKDAALQRSFSAEEVEEASFFETSDYSGSPHRASYNQTDVKDQNEHSKMTPEGHSPLKVLSLINLQCKRLLHHRDADESEPNSLCPSSQLRIDQLKAAAKLMNQEVEGDCSSSEFTFRPFVLKHEGEEIPSHVATEEAKAISTGVGSNPQLCVKKSTVSSLQSQKAGKSETVFMKDAASESSQFHLEDKNEDSRNGQSEWNGEQTGEYLTSEETTEHLTSENISNITKPIPSEFLNTHQTYSSNGEAVIFRMKPELKLDCNANLSLLIEATNDPQLQSLHISRPLSPAAAHPCIITEEGHPLVERGVSHQEVTGALPGHQNTPISYAQAPKRGVSKPQLGPGQKEDAAPSVAQPWRAKTPRKQPRPSRSVDIHDPDLQGVMFRMDPELDDSREQCRLLITSEYR